MAAFALLVIGASWSSAAADESAPYAYPEITQQDIEDAARSSDLGDGEVSEGIEGQITDPGAAEELPHSNLNREQALEMLTRVFSVPLEGLSGPYSQLHVQRFLSNRAAVVAPGEQPGYGGLLIGKDAESTGPTLLQSTIPLRTENASGEEEAVDLGLAHSEGELQPGNPLADVGIPEELGEGIRLGGESGGEEPLGISFVSEAGERAPSTVGGTLAVYPNVETDTDLAVAPTPEGVETLTQLRSPKAPTLETFRLELPPEAKLEAREEGGAEVRRKDGEPLVKILPPSAIDAEGTEVPVSMSVSDDTLTLRISTRESTAFPVLVDPMYQTYQWYELSTTQGAGDFAVETNEPSLLTGTYWSPVMPNPGTYLNSPGLYVQAHANTAVGAGASAAWSYYVPRLKSDEATYHDPPHTYISGMHLHDLGFFTEKEVNGVKYSDGGSNPHLWSGIWDGFNSTWPSSYFHDGPEGQINNFAATFDFASTDENGKIAEPVALSSYAWRWMGENWREAYVGYVGIEVSEQEKTRNPTWGPTAGPGWVNAAATKPLEVTAEDLGLGVRSLKVEGTGAGTITTSVGCSGLASSPCPRKYKALINGYEPAKMAQGIDWVNVTAEDVLGNRSAEPTPIQVKVDHTAPNLTVTGSVTEQAARGTWLESYSVKVKGVDGSTAAPQSGVVKSVIKVDGTVADEYSPGCATNSCELSRERQLEAGKYTPGKHNVEVIVTDGVGLTTSKVVTIELHPDHLPPVVALSGSMTEQAGLGTTLPRYTLKASATDPNEGGEPSNSSSFGVVGTGSGQFKNPADVAIDASGNLWAVDKGNNRIVEYNEAGEFLREAGGSGSSGGKLSSPSGIAIDSAGNLDVTDTANNRVAQFSSTGAFIEVIGSNVNKTKVEAGGTALEKNRCTAASGNTCQAGTAGTGEGQISEPIGITTTGGTNFFVVERANNRVEKFSPQAERLAQFGSLGSENGQLKEPNGIAFHGFLLWVADTGNERMEAFTTSYVYSRKFGGAGSGNGPLGKPVGVDADESGNVWVAEQANNRVQKFSENGTFLLQFGIAGSQAGQFNLPGGLAIDAKGNLLVADTNNNRIEKWTASSGVASVSIKVDGTVVSSTVPGCPLGGCSIVREWTLNSSSYSVGPHTVEASAVDAAGHAATQTVTINIARDQTAPQLSATGALVNAPMGWVEEKVYPYSVSATDTGGFGVTSLVFKIDGVTVNSASQTCLNGGCPATLSGTINAANYAAGAHSAELVGIDGAGNIARKTWTMKVDPEGLVTADEATDTFEALEQTAEVAPVASNGEILEPEQMEAGDNPSLQLENGSLLSSGVPDKTEIAVGQRPEFVVKGPNGDLEVELQGGSEPNPVKVTGDVAAVAPSSEPGVDTVIRPEYNGALAFQEIREPTSPEQFIWKVRLGSEQDLVAVDNHNAEVKWANGPRAYLIVAEAAHDATGRELETSLSVKQPDLVTLTVRHRVAGVVYPVLAGQGFLTSYHPAVVTGPLTNPEPESVEEPDLTPQEVAEFPEPHTQTQFNAWASLGGEDRRIVPPPFPSYEGMVRSTLYRSQCGPNCSKWNAKVYNAGILTATDKSWSKWESGTEIHATITQNWKAELIFFGNRYSCGWKGPKFVRRNSGEHLFAYGHFSIEGWLGVPKPSERPAYEANLALQAWVYPNGFQEKHPIWDWSGEPSTKECPVGGPVP